MQSDYGNFKVVKIEEGYDFWCLIHALEDDNSNFLNNVNTLVERYKEGNLFGLKVTETDSMYQRNAREDDIFCRHIDGTLSFYLLPCFCTVTKQFAEICWVHSRYRRLGIGTALVSLLKIKYVFNPLHESLPFWNAVLGPNAHARYS